MAGGKKNEAKKAQSAAAPPEGRKNPGAKSGLPANPQPENKLYAPAIAEMPANRQPGMKKLVFSESSQNFESTHSSAHMERNFGTAVKKEPEMPKTPPEEIDVELVEKPAINIAQKTDAIVQAASPAAPSSNQVPPGQFVRVQTGLVQADPTRVIEAALFMSGQSLASADLAKLVGIAAVGFVDEKLSALSREYEEKKSAIEIVREDNGKWAMRVRAAYAPAVRGFAGEAEISKHALKTLAYISKNEGIKKRDLFKKLGSSIYENVAELIDKGFVLATPAGRTVSLKTTGKFRQYFEG